MPELTYPDPPLSDGVITLRRPTPADRDAVVAALQDPEIPRWTTVPSPYGPADFDAWLAAGGHALRFVITKPDGTIVGGAGVHVTEGDPDIGYWCAGEHRGRGYTVRAVRLLRDHVRALGFERVDLLVHRDNVASQGVARKAGFTRLDGLVTCSRGCSAERDHVRFTFA